MTTNYSLFTNLAKLAMHKDASSISRAVVNMKMEQLKSWLTEKAKVTMDESWKAHYLFIASQINAYQDDPSEYKQESLLPAPPGQPIGDYDLEFCGN
jgi:hypothetical protein